VGLLQAMIDVYNYMLKKFWMMVPQVPTAPRKLVQDILIHNYPDHTLLDLTALEVSMLPR
jgi:hypothetical protein